VRPIPSLILIAPAALVASPGFAAAYLTIPQAQAELFPEATVFVEHKVELTDEQRKAIKALSGTRQRSNEVLAWRAEKEGRLLGWFLVDEVVGKHEFITYACGLTPEGKVVGIDILVYRETYGYQVREADWRNRFVGKSLADAFELDKDVPNITGATLSCRNVTQGVKRLLAVQRTALNPKA
jgi:electron transport complex protein RnfG